MARRYFKYDDLGNIIQIFESSMQAPQEGQWDDVTDRSDIGAVLRKTQLYRKDNNNNFVLKPEAIVKTSKSEIIADGEDVVEVWIECPEYPEEIFSLVAEDQLISVVPMERIEISAVNPGVLSFNVKSRIVRPTPASVIAKKA